MPIQTANLLSPLSALHPFRDVGGDNLDMERQRLELMRQQFEETKRQNLQDEEYKRLAQAAATRREELINEREKQKAEALAAAENLKQRQLALGEFNKQYYEGNLEGMSLAAAQLNQLGGYARRLDAGDSGFPAWQVDLEPPKVPQGLNPVDSLGYNTLGTGDRLEETEKGAAPALSTEEAFRQAGSVPAEVPQAPSAGDPTTDEVDALTSEHLMPGGEATTTYDQYGPPQAPVAPPSAPSLPPSLQGLTPGMTHFAPRRAAEAPDMTGGVTNDVPQDVINTAAMQYQREQRLGPVMSAMAQAYPEGYRSHIEQAGNAMLGAGLSPEKTMQNAQAARQEVGGAYEKEQAHQFKLEEEAAKANAPLKRTEEQEIVQKGFKRAEAIFTKKKIPDALGSFAIADEIEQMLTGASPLGQDRAINLLGQLNAQSKQQSDADANRLTGLDRAALTTKLDQYIFQLTNSGFNEDIKASMLEFVHNIREHSKTAVHDWMESTVRQADSNGEPLIGRGYREFLETAIPQDLLHEYDKDAGDTEEPREQTSAGGGALEDMAAEHGFNASALRHVIGGESKGKPQAANKDSSAKGLWQALDSTAQRFVNPRTGEKFKDSKELAQLSPAEQYDVLAQYLADSGVTEDSPPEDYALAIAAPAFVGKGAHEDMVVYPKGSEKWTINKPWRPADDGDITVGSIIDYYFGNKKQGAAKPKGGKGADDAEALEGL